MICSLCQLEKIPKKNTHYLTDSIIRSALNEGGVNEREKGLYFVIDPDTVFAEMKFQRGASAEKLEELLGRQTTDEENIESSKNIEFSVNDKFCKQCEDIFGVIENAFNQHIVKYYREQFSAEKDLIIFTVEESKIVRLFFLMQFWRTSICDDAFSISADVAEFLRTKILNVEYEDLECIPLSVTYLETLPNPEDIDIVTGKPINEKYRGSNHVIVVEGSNPYIIIMNDFAIQMYDDIRQPFESFYGLNSTELYVRLFNYNQDIFYSSVFLNDERNAFIYRFSAKAARFKNTQSVEFFCSEFEERFGCNPDVVSISNYMDRLINHEHFNKFSNEFLQAFTDDFFAKYEGS